MNSPEIEFLQERLLVLQAQCREDAAFHRLVKMYERRLLYYIRRIVGEPGASDVLQDVWIKVFVKLPTLKSAEAFRVWLYKIAHDLSVRHLRKKRRHEELLEEDHRPAIESETWNEFELLEQAEIVHRALGEMSLSHREVLTLRFLEGLELAEIAEVIGCSLGTVKSRLHYAKCQMRKTMEASHE